MARTISPNHGRKKEKILFQSTKAFAQNGYHNTPMDLIAKNCKMSKALIYHYFSTKNALLFECMIEYVTQLEMIMRDVESQPHDAQAALGEIIRRFLLVYNKSKYHHMVLVNELKNLNKTQRSQVVEKQNFLIHTLGRLLREMNPALAKKDGMETVAAMVLLGAINWTYTWFNPDGPVSTEELADFVNKVFQTGLVQGLGRD